MTTHHAQAEELLTSAQNWYDQNGPRDAGTQASLATAHAVLALLDRIEQAEAEVDTKWATPDELRSDNARLIHENSGLRQSITALDSNYNTLRTRLENQRRTIHSVTDLADQLADIPEHQTMAARIREALGLTDDA